MADAAQDKKGEETGDKGPQPSFTVEDIRKAVGEEVESRMAAYTPPQPEERPADRRPVATERNPLADVIGPLVNPALSHLGVEVADAKDAALFYAEHPEALKHKKGVEAAFEEMKKRGTPMARNAVFTWYKGQHFEDFHKAAQEDEKAAAERAKDAADTGPGSPRRREAAPKDPHTMSDEDLAKSLEGVAF